MAKAATSRVQTVIGIDPGLSGAIAVLGFGGRPGRSQFVSVWSMPVEIKPSGRRQVNANVLYTLLSEIGVSRFAIERVSAMPGQGVSGMFSLGDSFGCVRALAEPFTEHPVALIAPQVWKAAMGLRKQKKTASLSLARRLYPDARPYLHRKKDEGRAEAILIAHYARTVLQW